MASAVAHLHERSIAHRDIKPDNLVFDSLGADASVRLIDFGYAGTCERGKQLEGLCGTPDYAAPEILTWYSADKAVKARGTGYGTAVDIWSLGVVLYIVLCGFPPFYGDDDEQMFAAIRSATYAFPPDIDGYQTTWATTSDGAKDLVRRMLALEPGERIKASEVLTCGWLRNKGTRTPRDWLGKMRDRSASGWRDKEEGAPRLDRGQIDRGGDRAKPAKINTDSKQINMGDGGGKLNHTLGQQNLVNQFSRWIVDRMFVRRVRRSLAPISAPRAHLGLISA